MIMMTKMKNFNLIQILKNKIKVKTLNNLINNKNNNYNPLKHNPQNN